MYTNKIIMPPKIIIFAIVASWMSVLSPKSSVALSDIFLEIAGIEGESQDRDHKGQIDVLSWSWGVSRSVDINSVGSSSSASFNDFVITKRVDKSSPVLFGRCASSARLDSIILWVRASGTNNDYLKITMTDVYVSGISSTGSIETEQASESISFIYSTIQTVYYPTNSDGSLGSGVSSGWDLITNTAF
jgi:type VI secretion system secreted protein Hcp